MATVADRNNAGVVDSPAGKFGYFRATGVSETVSGMCIEIMMNFGSGSVDIEKQMPSGEWIKIETAITEDYGNVFDSPGHSLLRLNCTAYTSPIEYSMKSGTRD